MLKFIIAAATATSWYGGSTASEDRTSYAIGIIGAIVFVVVGAWIYGASLPMLAHTTNTAEPQRKHHCGFTSEGLLFSLACSVQRKLDLNGILIHYF